MYPPPVLIQWVAEQSSAGYHLCMSDVTGSWSIDSGVHELHAVGQVKSMAEHNNNSKCNIIDTDLV